MNYAFASNTGITAYPIDLSVEFPNTLFPSPLAASCLPEGVVEVLPTSRPTILYSQKAVEGSPVFEDDKWKQTWTVEDLPTDEVAVNLAGLRANLCHQVDQDRDTRTVAGFTYDGHLYQSRDGDQINLIGMFAAALANPAFTTNWITADNSYVPLDAAGMVALYTTGLTFKRNLTFYARDLKDAILASDNPQSIYDAASWPA